MSIRVSRSSLIMPINVTRFVERAWTRGVEHITLDLEDSVAPDQKSAARSLVQEAIKIASKGGATISVRVNRDSIQEDLTASIWPGLQSITLSKTESAEEVQHMAEIIGSLEKERGIEKGSIGINPLIESAKGVWNAYQIATASPRIRSFGGVSPGDTTADLGVEMAGDVDQLFYCRGEVDLIARSLQLGGTAKWQPSMGALFQYGDDTSLLQRAEQNRRQGIRGSGGIHPSVVEANNRGFTPTSEEIQETVKVVSAFDDAQEKGQAYGVFNGRVILSHNARWAKEYIQYAEACAEKDKEKTQIMTRLWGKESPKTPRGI